MTHITESESVALQLDTATEEIEAQLRQRAVVDEDATNAQRLRHVRALVMLNEEMDRRLKALEQSQKRDG